MHVPFKIFVAPLELSIVLLCDADGRAPHNPQQICDPRSPTGAPVPSFARPPRSHRLFARASCEDPTPIVRRRGATLDFFPPPKCFFLVVFPAKYNGLYTQIHRTQSVDNFFGNKRNNAKPPPQTPKLHIILLSIACAPATKQSGGGGSSFRYACASKQRKLPTTIEGCESLKGKLSLSPPTQPLDATLRRNL